MISGVECLCSFLQEIGIIISRYQNKILNIYICIVFYISQYILKNLVNEEFFNNRYEE